jgi:1-aminocyclopropane-1-carboxylate deaminase/D-cysteine desulfhydrase-like pyridoxal-dependent ACC family enzyme
MLPLFERYPLLKENLSHVALGDFPTPVEKLERLGEAIHAPQLYAKRDDASGKLYGGNKVHALEFLFGNSIRAGHQQVVALGFPASCQALAQAIYARELGLHSTAFLFPQIRSRQARQHLLIYQSLNADIRPTIPMILPFMLRHRLKYGCFPKLLEASSPVGMIGYVSAGLELKEQIEQGLIPEPDLVYLSLATMGTTIGLMLGFRAAGLNTQVIGIDDGARVMGRKVATPPHMVKLFHETNELLHSNDPSFPLLKISESNFHIRSGYEREKDSLINAAGAQAMARAKELANLQLDEMFTANAFAALLADGESGALQDKTVLWWNTYNSIDFSAQIASADYRQLPRYFQRYFENGAQ